MRIVFIGAVESSRVALNALLQCRVDIRCVITLHKERGVSHSDYVDLSHTCESAGVPIEYSRKINDAETLEIVRKQHPDLCIVVGWSQLCSPDFLSIARLGNIGFHPSLLPKMRGRAVIPWTILLGDKRTGSTLFWIDASTDSGPILLQKEIELAPQETSTSLYARHTANLAEMLPEAISLIKVGQAPRIKQDDAEATYCSRRTPADSRIDWNAPAEEILRLIRAVAPPYPGAFTYSGDDKLFIESAEIVPDGCKYIGFAGQIQAHRDGAFIVRCGDGKCIGVTGWRSSARKLPMVHERLGWRGS